MECLTFMLRRGLFACYGVDLHGLRMAVKDDFYSVEMPYKSENASAIYAAFDRYGDDAVDAHERILTTEGCFNACEDGEDLAFFNRPDLARAPSRPNPSNRPQRGSVC